MNVLWTLRASCSYWAMWYLDGVHNGCVVGLYVHPVVTGQCGT